MNISIPAVSGSAENVHLAPVKQRAPGASETAHCAPLDFQAQHQIGQPGGIVPGGFELVFLKPDIPAERPAAVFCGERIQSTALRVLKIEAGIAGNSQGNLARGLRIVLDIGSSVKPHQGAVAPDIDRLKRVAQIKPGMVDSGYRKTEARVKALVAVLERIVAQAAPHVEYPDTH